MAKSKKSRRTRRQETEKQKQQATQNITVEASAEAISDDAPVVVKANLPASTANGAASAPAASRKTINFAQEYFYVYGELRNILIVALLMFGVLIGLSFVI